MGKGNTPDYGESRRSEPATDPIFSLKFSTKKETKREQEMPAMTTAAKAMDAAKPVIVNVSTEFGCLFEIF